MGVLQDIAHIARQLRDYRHFAAVVADADEYRNIADVYDVDDIDLYRIAGADEAEASRDNLAPYVAKLAELCDEHLPAISRVFVRLPVILPWHKRQNFDWDGAAAELQMIEKAAEEAAAENSRSDRASNRRSQQVAAHTIAAKKRPGRPPATTEEIVADMKLFEEWQRARTAKVPLTEFAQGRAMTMKEVAKAIGRHSKRVKRGSTND